MTSSADVAPHPLRPFRVLRVAEDACEACSDGQFISARFAPMFPGPRVERVSPGHLVAVATTRAGAHVVVWRWYDAVVLDHESGDAVRLWEPGHGEVLARMRPSYRQVEPGERAYASAGLPGAEWWVAGPAATSPALADVDLDAVAALYSDNGLWAAALAPEG